MHILQAMRKWRHRVKGMGLTLIQMQSTECKSTGMPYLRRYLGLAWKKANSFFIDASESL